MRDSMVTDFGDSSDNATVKSSSDKSDDCDTVLFVFLITGENMLSLGLRWEQCKRRGREKEGAQTLKRR